MTEFEETAFESIVDKIVVKSQHELEFHLIGGLKFEEKNIAKLPCKSNRKAVFCCCW